MKYFLMICLLAGMSTASLAQYKPTDQGSTLEFNVKNLGFNVEGSFTGFEGAINFDPQNAAKSSFDVTINAGTVNTDNSLRDEHLKADGYFDVQHSPKIRLVADKVSGSGKGFQFNGQLSIKGKAKPVSFPFTAVAAGDGYVFKGSFKINRKDFAVGGTSTIGDEVEVILNVAVKKAA